jgi:hypothetical protein
MKIQPGREGKGEKKDKLLVGLTYCGHVNDHELWI